MSELDYSDNESEENVGESGPMMSIFASYYGIEEEVNEASKSSGTIDDANFQCDAYVKDLLVKETVEGLVAKDTEMIHEIRTLDGEMQKLVYDNYNKFITATETIKEMKNDVFGMDGDMSKVRKKMAEISQKSQALDEVLHEKRNHIDKLVRVRRLLNRLEFLSELPEKLAEMIDNKLYKEAVQLYNKTISVLTRHSHVLSFKNIKERTELMMNDLTKKVTNLLDDITLEDVKLTQYVGVLRLMKAPRNIVTQKLLAAHKNKAMRMIQVFSRNLNANNANVTDASAMQSASSLVLDMLNDISNTRKFHQSIMVGLIESCKGMSELYQYLPEENDDPAQEEKLSEKDLQEYKNSYIALQSMITEVMNEYSKVFTQAFQKFFTRYHEHFLSFPVNFLELDDSYKNILEELANIKKGIESAAAATTPSNITRQSSASIASQEETVNIDKLNFQRDISSISSASLDSEELQARTFKSSELNEERSLWLLLANQAINDVIYLDSAQLECAVTLHFHHKHYTYYTKPKASTTTTKHSGHSNTKIDECLVDKFVDSLIVILSNHCDILQTHRVVSYVKSIHKWLPKIQSLCDIVTVKKPIDPNDIKYNRGGGGNSRYGNNNTTMITSTNDPVADRQTLHRHIVLAKKILDMLLNHATLTFTESAKEIKPIVDEIYKTANRDTEAVSMNLVSKYCNILAHEIEKICNVINHKCYYDITNNTLTYYNANHGGHNHNNINNNAADHDGDDGDNNHDDDNDEIYNDIDIKEFDAKDAIKSDEELNPFETNLSLQQPHLLLYSSVVRKLLNVVMINIRTTLREQELSGIEGRIEFKEQCLNRLQLTGQLILTKFINTNARYISKHLTSAQCEIFYEHYQYNTLSSEPTKQITLSDTMLHIGKYLDYFAITGCIMLTESPPQLKMSSGDVSNSGMRRGSTTVGRSSIAGHNLQLDIERLFAQKIKVYDTINATIPLDFIINTIFKAALKATQETVRSMTFPFNAYVQVQANATFIKQVASCLLKETTEADSLAEQILSTTFSRYIGANDIANASDGNEQQLIARSLVEAFQKLQQNSNTVLLTR